MLLGNAALARGNPGINPLLAQALQTQLQNQLIAANKSNAATHLLYPGLQTSSPTLNSNEVFSQNMNSLFAAASSRSPSTTPPQVTKPSPSVFNVNPLMKSQDNGLQAALAASGLLDMQNRKSN